MPAVVAILSGLTTALLVLAMFRPNHTLPVRRRVRGLGTGEALDPYERSFAERLLQPPLRRVRTAVAALVPVRLADAIDARLERAGRPLALNRFISIWLASGFLPLFIVFFLALATVGTIGSAQLAVAVFAMMAGALAPWLWLRRRVDGRRKQIERSLPDAIDLIVTNAEAGRGLQASMLAVADKFPGPIAGELRYAVGEVSVGRPVTEAMAAMAERSGSTDMRLFATAVAHSQRNGVPIAEVLRNHAAEIRERRRQRAREMAGRIPVKITIPTMLFIFPTIFLLVLGPVILHVIDTFPGLDG
jgi:tight adherence protein C